MDLRGKRIFITGITSPLGRETAALLAEAGGRVAGLVRDGSRSRLLPPEVDVVEGDCGRPHDYQRYVRTSSFVIHAAGLHLSSEIIRACAGCDQLERIVFIGSMRSEYPDRLLSGTERSQKRLLRDKENEISTSLLPWTILRPTLIFSSGDRSFSRVRNFMAARHFFLVPGSGRAVRQPISARDLAASTVKALLAPSAHRRSYDVPGRKISVREILEIMGEEMGMSVKLIPVPALPARAAKGICRFFGMERYETALTSFLRWYHGFDWPDGAASEDFGHSPRSFRRNVREQIAGEASMRESIR